MYCAIDVSQPQQIKFDVCFLLRRKSHPSKQWAFGQCYCTRRPEIGSYQHNEHEYDHYIIYLSGKVYAKAEYQQVVHTINKHQLDVDLPVCYMLCCLIHKAKVSGFYLSWSWHVCLELDWILIWHWCITTRDTYGGLIF